MEPRFDQSYGNDPCFPGNPNLLPERSRTIHAGFRAEACLWIRDTHLGRSISTAASTTLSVLMTVAPSAACLAIGDRLRRRPEHISTPIWRARARVNLSGEARLTRWLNASAHYTYDSTRTLSAPTDPVNIDPNYLVGSRLLRRPVNSGNVMLDASLWHMNWNLNGYFTGQRFDYNYPGQIYRSRLHSARILLRPIISPTGSAFMAASRILPTSNTRTPMVTPL